MKNHTRYVTDACGRPFDPSTRPDTMTEAQFDHLLREMKPSERILALCDRVDDILKEAGVYEEKMAQALARKRSDDEIMADVRLLEGLRRG